MLKEIEANKELIRNQSTSDTLYDTKIKEALVDAGYTYDKQFAIIIKALQGETKEFDELVKFISKIKGEPNNEEDVTEGE